MDISIIRFFYFWLLPPAVFVIMLLLILKLHRRPRQLYLGVIIIAISLYTVSLFPVSELLLRPLEYRYVTPEKPIGDVIVVLGGGTIKNIPLPAGWSGQVGDEAAQRMLAAYTIHRKHGYPVLVSGGDAAPGAGNEARIMRDILIGLGMDEANVILEEQSKNTEQNALFSAQILKEKGLSTPILVTSAFHMQRSVMHFVKAGVQNTVPYPVGYRSQRETQLGVFSFVPSDYALRGTSLAMKEYLGLLVLHLR